MSTTSAGPLAAALGVGVDESGHKRVLAVSTKLPMTQAWSAIVSGQRTGSVIAELANASTAAPSTSSSLLVNSSPGMTLTTCGSSGVQASRSVSQESVRMNRDMQNSQLDQARHMESDTSLACNFANKDSHFMPYRNARPKILKPGGRKSEDYDAPNMASRPISSSEVTSSTNLGKFGNFQAAGISSPSIRLPARADTTSNSQSAAPVNDNIPPATSYFQKRWTDETTDQSEDDSTGGSDSDKASKHKVEDNLEDRARTHHDQAPNDVADARNVTAGTKDDQILSGNWDGGSAGGPPTPVQTRMPHTGADLRRQQLQPLQQRIDRLDEQLLRRRQKTRGSNELGRDHTGICRSDNFVQQLGGIQNQKIDLGGQQRRPMHERDINWDQVGGWDDSSASRQQPYRSHGAQPQSRQRIQEQLSVDQVNRNIWRPETTGDGVLRRTAEHDVINATPRSGSGQCTNRSAGSSLNRLMEQPQDSQQYDDVPCARQTNTGSNLREGSTFTNVPRVTDGTNKSVQSAPYMYHRVMGSVSPQQQGGGYTIASVPPIHQRPTQFAFPDYTQAPRMYRTSWGSDPYATAATAPTQSMQADISMLPPGAITYPPDGSLVASTFSAQQPYPTENPSNITMTAVPNGVSQYVCPPQHALIQMQGKFAPRRMPVDGITEQQTRIQSASHSAGDATVPDYRQLASAVGGASTGIYGYASQDLTSLEDQAQSGRWGYPPNVAYFYYGQQPTGPYTIDERYARPFYDSLTSTSTTYPPQGGIPVGGQMQQFESLRRQLVTPQTESQQPQMQVHQPQPPQQTQAHGGRENSEAGPYQKDQSGHTSIDQSYRGARPQQHYEPRQQQSSTTPQDREVLSQTQRNEVEPRHLAPRKQSGFVSRRQNDRQSQGQVQHQIRTLPQSPWRGQAHSSHLWLNRVPEAGVRTLAERKLPLGTYDSTHNRYVDAVRGAQNTSQNEKKTWEEKYKLKVHNECLAPKLYQSKVVSESNMSQKPPESAGARQSDTADDDIGVPKARKAFEDGGPEARPIPANRQSTPKQAPQRVSQPQPPDQQGRTMAQRGMQDLPSHQHRERIVCRHYLRGRCHYANCNFVHPAQPDSNKVREISSAPRRSRTLHQLKGKEEARSHDNGNQMSDRKAEGAIDETEKSTTALSEQKIEKQGQELVAAADSVAFSRQSPQEHLLRSHPRQSRQVQHHQNRQQPYQQSQYRSFPTYREQRDKKAFKGASCQLSVSAQTPNQKELVKGNFDGQPAGISGNGTKEAPAKPQPPLQPDKVTKQAEAALHLSSVAGGLQGTERLSTTKSDNLKKRKNKKRKSNSAMRNAKTVGATPSAVGNTVIIDSTPITSNAVKAPTSTVVSSKDTTDKARRPLEHLSREDKAAQARNFKTSIAGTLKQSPGVGNRLSSASEAASSESVAVKSLPLPISLAVSTSPNSSTLNASFSSPLENPISTSVTTAATTVSDAPATTAQQAASDSSIQKQQEERGGKRRTWRERRRRNANHSNVHSSVQLKENSRNAREQPTSQSAGIEPIQAASSSDHGTCTVNESKKESFSSNAPPQPTLGHFQARNNTSTYRYPRGGGPWRGRGRGGFRGGNRGGGGGARYTPVSQPSSSEKKP